MLWIQIRIRLTLELSKMVAWPFEYSTVSQECSTSMNPGVHTIIHSYISPALKPDSYILRTKTTCTPCHRLCSYWRRIHQQTNIQNKHTIIINIPDSEQYDQMKAHFVNQSHADVLWNYDQLIQMHIIALKRKYKTVQMLHYIGCRTNRNRWIQFVASRCPTGN